MKVIVFKGTINEVIKEIKENEIKEILKDIEKGVKTGKDKNDIKVGGICYEWQDLKIVLDYITNLQQEINKLTAESTEWESKCYDLQQENERLNEIFVWKQEHEKELHTRIEKAIDKLTIKQARFINEKDYVLDDNDLDEIMYILQNGSDDNE